MFLQIATIGQDAALVLDNGTTVSGVVDTINEGTVILRRPTGKVGIALTTIVMVERGLATTPNGANGTARMSETSLHVSATSGPAADSPAATDDGNDLPPLGVPVPDAGAPDVCPRRSLETASPTFLSPVFYVPGDELLTRLLESEYQSVVSAVRAGETAARFGKVQQAIRSLKPDRIDGEGRERALRVRAFADAVAGNYEDSLATYCEALTTSGLDSDRAMIHILSALLDQDDPVESTFESIEIALKLIDSRPSDAAPDTPVVVDRKSHKYYRRVVAEPVQMRAAQVVPRAAGTPAGRSPQPAAKPSHPPSPLPAMSGERAYKEAHRLETKKGARKRDLEKAEKLYRRAIAAGYRVDAAVRSLAWLTKRNSGLQAALGVLQVEFADRLTPSAQLDNLLEALLAEARDYAQLKPVVERKLARGDLTASQRLHTLKNLGTAQLSLGENAEKAWRRAFELDPDDAAARQGLVMALASSSLPAAVEEARELANSASDDERDALIEIIDTEGVSKRLIDQLNAKSYWTTQYTEYVMDQYSDAERAKAEILALRKNGITYADVQAYVDTGNTHRGHRPRETVEPFLVAVSLATDIGANDQYVIGFLCEAITSLADTMVFKGSLAAARDLYCEALSQGQFLDESLERETLQLALARAFLATTPGNRSNLMHIRLDSREHPEPTTEGQLGHVLADALDLDPENAQLVFGAVRDRAPAIAALLDRCVSNDPRLERYLDDQLWREWDRRRARVHTVFSSWRGVRLSGDAVARMRESIRELIEDSSDDLREAAGQIVDRVLGELGRFFADSEFDQKAQSLRQALATIDGVEQTIHDNPTELLVTVVLPFLGRLRNATRELEGSYLAGAAPQPELEVVQAVQASLADVVRIQVKVSNSVGVGASAADFAPIENPSLTILLPGNVDASIRFERDLPPVIRGGDQAIALVLLPGDAAAAKAEAFTVRAVLNYTSSGQPLTYDRSLPVNLSGGQFSKVHNPFVPGATGLPVPREMFYGRDQIVETVVSSIVGAGVPLSYYVYGQKRSGKSSIRLRIADKLRENGNVLVADIENIGKLAPGETGSDAGDEKLNLFPALLWRIAEEIDRAAKRMGETGPLEGRSKNEFLAAGAPAMEFIDLLRDWRSEAGPWSDVVVLVDEFQYLDSWVRKGYLNSAVFQALKAIIEARLFHILIFGQEGLQRMISEHSNTFASFKPHRVSYLGKEEARELASRPIYIPGTEEQSRYLENALDRVLDLTGCHAWYIQRLCNELVDYMNRVKTAFVTEADVDIVFAEFLKNLRKNDFDNFENPDDENPEDPEGASRASETRRVMRAIAAAGREVGGKARRQDVVAQYGDETGLSLKDQLDDLVGRDVIREEDGRYRIIVQMYEEWLLSRA